MELTSSTLILFLLAVGLGSYVQAVAGFAMGMIIMAVISALALLPLPVVAAVVSLLSMINVVLSLHGHYHLVHGVALRSLCLGQVPAICIGVWALGWLDVRAESALQLLLGTFIVFGSFSMMLRPMLRPGVSSSAAFFGAGFAGGLLGGLFSASGPVIGWFCYRQPLPVTEIRATMLSCFAIATVVRTLVVGVRGELTPQVWWLTSVAIPLVLICTWLGRRFPPAVSEDMLRRMAFGLLCAAGIWILVRPVLALAS